MAQILKVLWVKHYQTAFQATEKLSVKGNHYLNQSVAINMETKLTTNKKIMTSWSVCPVVGAETNTTLGISYTPIKKKKKNIYIYKYIYI